MIPSSFEPADRPLDGGSTVGTITSVEGPRPGTTAIGRAIAEHGYREDEHVVRGTADLYAHDGDWRPVLHRPDVPFVTRVTGQQDLGHRGSSRVVAV